MDVSTCSYWLSGKTDLQLAGIANHVSGFKGAAHRLRSKVWRIDCSGAWYNAASAKRDRNLTHVGDIADGLDSNPANQTCMYASISYDWHDAHAWQFAKSYITFFSIILPFVDLAPYPIV